MAIYYSEDGIRSEAKGEILDSILAVEAAATAQKLADEAAASKAAADKASAIAKLTAQTYIPLTADEAATIVI